MCVCVFVVSALSLLLVACWLCKRQKNTGKDCVLIVNFLSASVHGIFAKMNCAINFNTTYSNISKVHHVQLIIVDGVISVDSVGSKVDNCIRFYINRMTIVNAIGG